MTKEEATQIKGEIIKKEVSVNVGNVILSAGGTVLLEDMLEIINSHIDKEGTE